MRGLWGTTALAAVMGMAGAASAQTGDRVVYADAGEQVTVTATRSATDTFEAPSTVTVIDDETIEENLVTDIKDLVRFEPGVSVRNSPARFGAALGSTGRDGNAGFNIRGLEGNRVLMVVDGVRVPDEFTFGPAAFGRGDYVDLDLLGSVEILRGPASALYGSDGVAGVVSFITRDPSDFLAEGESFGARLRASYASADDSWAEGVSGAARFGAWSILGAYTHRDAHETENQGENASLNSTRTVPNPQDISSDAAMGRLVFEPSAQHRFRLTVDHGQREVESEVLSARSGTVLDLSTLDESERSRIAFDHTFENGGGAIDRAFWTAYYQTSESSQFSDEQRVGGMFPSRTRRTEFDNDVFGVSGQLESEFEAGSVGHHFIYGADYSVTTQEGLRGGAVPPAGESFPVRAFPNTEYTLMGAFVQDEISLLGGSLLLFPGVRYDEFEINPQADALYPGVVTGTSDSRVTPRFGIVAWPTQTFGAFFNYAQGFKPPAPGQVNNFFENLNPGPGQPRYRSEPNPNLQPETSESIEVGVRFRDINLLGASWRASLAAFGASFEDFISQEPISGTGAVGDPIVYQFVNLADVDIAGVEARADGHWENGIGFIVSAAVNEGTQRVAGARAPLNSIDPLRVVAGLSYDHRSGRFGGQAIVTYSEQKDRDNINENCVNGFSPAPCFAPDAFTILDITGYVHLTDRATLRAGLFNVTDETYWWWSDVRGTAATSTALDAFTQPGQNFSASISYRF